MSLDLLLRYINFNESTDEAIKLEVTDNEHTWNYDDYRDVPYRLMVREVESFAPTLINGCPCLWVRLYDE